MISGRNIWDRGLEEDFVNFMTERTWLGLTVSPVKYCLFQKTEGDHLDQDGGPAERELDRSEGAGAGAHLPVQSGGGGRWVDDNDDVEPGRTSVQSDGGGRGQL